MHPIDDPKKFERVSFGEAAVREQQAPPPTQRSLPRPGGAAASMSPDAFLSEDANGGGFQAPAPRPVAKQQQAAQQDEAAPPPKKRSAFMKRLQKAYALEQVEPKEVPIHDDMSVMVRALGAEDFAWAMERSSKFGFQEQLSNERMYGLALAAIATSALLVKNDEGAWVEEPMYISLGIITQEQARMVPIRDPHFPPFAFRRACAEEWYLMLVAGATKRDENLPADLGELILAGWEEKIGQRVEDLAAPLRQRRDALRPKPPNLPSAGDSQQSAEPQSQTPESPPSA